MRSRRARAPAQIQAQLEEDGVRDVQKHAQGFDYCGGGKCLRLNQQSHTCAEHLWVLLVRDRQPESAPSDIDYDEIPHIVHTFNAS
ncbi:MAG: hypothetical protein WCF30_17115 [Terracidiphilus sp.]